MKAECGRGLPFARFILCFLLISVLSKCTQAQQAADASASLIHSKGKVMGEVYDAVTQLPVRFAEIRLIPVPHEAAEANSQTATSESVSIHLKPQVMWVHGFSGLDGRVVMQGVPVGDYVVLALKAGYASPVPALDGTQCVGVQHLASLIAGLPSVHVTAGGEAIIHVPLQRGAVIAGTVRYADGSPAMHVAVAAQPMVQASEPDCTIVDDSAPMSAWETALLQPEHIASGRSRENLTDDQGRFRIVGLTAGRYTVSTATTVNHEAGQVAMSDGSTAPISASEPLYPELITIYAPGVFRQDLAEVYKLSVGEQLMPVDLTINTAGLHRLRGRVYAKSDQHAPTGLIVQLCHASDRTPLRFVTGEQDGSFQIDALPVGNYVLVIQGTEGNALGTRPIQFFRTMKVPVEMGETDAVIPDVALTLLPAGTFENVGLCGVPLSRSDR